MSVSARIRYRLRGEFDRARLTQILDVLSFSLGLQRGRSAEGKRPRAGAIGDSIEAKSVSADEIEVEFELEIPLIDGEVDFTLLYSFVLGSLLRDGRMKEIKLTALELPLICGSTIYGPSQGREQLREAIGRNEEPLLSVPLFPMASTEKRVSLAVRLALAGCTLLTDGPTVRYETVNSLISYVDSLSESLAFEGVRAAILVNGNSQVLWNGTAVEELSHRAAHGNRLLGVRVDPFVTGLQSVRKLAAAGLAVMCFSQFPRTFQGSQAGIAAGALASILRWLGATLVATGTGNPQGFETETDVLATVTCLNHDIRQADAVMKPAVPLFNGGIRPTDAFDLVKSFGHDTALHVGRGIMQGPLSTLEENLAAYREAGRAVSEYDSVALAIEKGGKDVAALVRYDRSTLQVL